MAPNKVLEQHIAVFGESGSGKTVLLSSFYGAAQEPTFIQSSLYDLTADDTGQGTELHRNYLGMKESNQRPPGTRFSADTYAFTLRLKDRIRKAAGRRPFEALRLVWHDYPGEWFEAEVDAEQAPRRVETFRSLLGSDVALLLVDGQRLLDNAGEEERYLRSLFANFRTGLVRLRDELLDDGKPLVRFPRIWVLALSKADLLPDLDVFGFRDLVIGKAADDLNELRDVIAGLIDSPDALALGEDFLLLSSAKFEPDRIEVTERIGLGLILPLASILPFQRHVKWAQRKQVGAAVARQLLGGANAIAALLIARPGGAGIKKRVLSLLRRQQMAASLIAVAELASDRADEIHERAIAEKDYMTAVLAGFETALRRAETGDRPTFLRSRK